MTMPDNEAYLRGPRSMNDLAVAEVLRLRVLYSPGDFQKITDLEPDKFAAQLTTFNQYTEELQNKARPQTLNEVSPEIRAELRRVYPEGLKRISELGPDEFVPFLRTFEDYLAGLPEQAGITYVRRLDRAAEHLRRANYFEAELTAGEAEEVIKQITADYQGAMNQRGVEVEIRRLSVQIADSRGEASTDVRASKKIAFGLIPVDADISASFILGNSSDQSGYLTGKLITRDLAVQPEVIGKDNVRAFFAQKVEGGNANEAFREVLMEEMRRRQAGIINLGLAFTPRDTLMIAATGGKID